jgi:hypothetical protein
MMMSGATMRAVGVLIAILAGSGCAGGERAGVGEPCRGPEECASGLVCVGGVCQRPGADGGEVGDADADADGDGRAEADGEVGTDACPIPCGAACCADGQRCFRDVCIPDAWTCAGGEPCQGDTTCVDGACVPFGPPFAPAFDAACAREPEPLESFEPEVQCAWPGTFVIDSPTSTSVAVPPLVADLDVDGVPEIVFTSCSGIDTTSGRVRAIRGDTCEPLWTSDHAAAVQQALAIGDLEGDGTPEVCSRDAAGVPFCLDRAGLLRWEGHDAAGAPVIPASANYWEAGLAIANVDGSGPPEVVACVMAFDGETGERVGGRECPPASGWTWTVPALADVDADGHVEALTGGWVLDLVTDELSDWGTSHGFVAVADLSPAYDGPEVVVVSYAGSLIRVQALDGTVVYQHAVPGNSGGPPTVADLDGDGQAEFSTAGNQFLTAFDLDCAGIRGATCPAGGAADGVLWSQPSHEYSSGITGSTVFDFEGDGAVEVVYADECWARVYDGVTGRVKFSTAHISGTAVEYPVVADVDGDFFTEIVVPHHRAPISCPAEDPLMPGVTGDPARPMTGLTVYRDRHDRWAPSRPLWSQHTEHYYQRHDDGSVPVVESPSWDGYNSYRQAHPRAGGTAIDSPDLTVGGVDASAPCDIGGDTPTQQLAARVCNRGTLPVAAGAIVAFYIDDPAGTPACTSATDRVLAPGECDDVGCRAEAVPLDVFYDIIAVVDPAASGDGAVTECHEDNNRAFFRDVCPRPVI